MNGSLDKGMPSDPRFPERDNEWVESCTKDYNLLLAWLEQFKSAFAEYPAAQETGTNPSPIQSPRTTSTKLCFGGRFHRSTLTNRIPIPTKRDQN
jgi:hypothetical protein